MVKLTEHWNINSKYVIYGRNKFVEIYFVTQLHQ